MNDGLTLRRLRRFLSLLAAFLFAGTIVELLAAEHYEGWQQLIPFALCGLGFLTTILAWRRPSRATVLALRGAMAVVIAGSLLGVYFHIQGNLGFARELDADAGAWKLVEDTFYGGNPIGASGILIVAALVATAATFATGVQAAEDAAPGAQSVLAPRSSWPASS